MLAWQIFYRLSYLPSSLGFQQFLEPLIPAGIGKLASHKNEHVMACEIYPTPKTTQLMFLNMLKLPNGFILDDSTRKDHILLLTAAETQNRCWVMKGRLVPSSQGSPQGSRSDKLLRPLTFSSPRQNTPHHTATLTNKRNQWSGHRLSSPHLVRKSQVDYVRTQQQPLLRAWKQL